MAAIGSAPNAYRDYYDAYTRASQLERMLLHQSHSALVGPGLSASVARGPGDDLVLLLLDR